MMKDKAAKLDHLAGEQTVEIPAKVDISRYHYLLLWSKQDHAVLARADLAGSGMGMGMEHHPMEHSQMEPDQMGGEMDPAKMSGGNDTMHDDPKSQQ